MSEAAKKIRARVQEEPDYPCMVKAEILGWADTADSEVRALLGERDKLREAILDALIDWDRTNPGTVRTKLRKAVGRVE